MVRVSDGHSIMHSPLTDRRQEFVAVLEALGPQVAARIEALGHFLIVVAVWGIVLFAVMATLTTQ